MSNVVKFLETLAADPDIRDLDEARALAERMLGEGGLSEALARGETHAITHLMQGAAITYCMLLPAEDDEPRRDEEQEEVPDRDAPDKESAALAA